MTVAKKQSTPDNMRVPLGIMAGTWSFLIGLVSIILLSVGYVSEANDASQTWSIGLYFLGGAAILAAFAYVDAVSLDQGRRDASVKKD